MTKAELARKGEMDPVIGRKNEIRRVVQGAKAFGIFHGCYCLCVRNEMEGGSILLQNSLINDVP